MRNFKTRRRFSHCNDFGRAILALLRDERPAQAKRGPAGLWRGTAGVELAACDTRVSAVATEGLVADNVVG